MTLHTITFEQADANGACSPGVTRMRRHLGASWPDDKPFPLTVVLDVSGFNDALWGLATVDKAAVRLVASDFAAHVAHHATDPRVAAAIRAARGHASGRVTLQALDDAASCAYYAADDAAAHSAAYAAYAAAAASDAADPYAAYAAYAADAADAAADAEHGRERTWQVAHLRAVLAGEKQPGRVRIRRAAS